MQIDADREKFMSRPHHHCHDGRPLDRKVFCDGVEQREVVEANTENGWCRLILRDHKGRVIIDRRRGVVVTKTIRGAISVEYPDR